jgi:hypothetical protein
LKTGSVFYIIVGLVVVTVLDPSVAVTVSTVPGVIYFGSGYS